MFKKEKYDKQHETDGQMLLRVSKKFAIIFSVILFFDVLIDLLSGAIDIALEALHLVINFFEYSFELLLEHILNANHHESEMIIVNGFILFAIYAVYRLIMLLPTLLRGWQRRLKLVWLLRKRRETDCWHHLSMKRKVEVCVVYSVGVFAVLFLFTL